MDTCTPPRPIVRNDTLIREHYRRVAVEHGANPTSSMEDQIIRAKELDVLSRYLRLLSRSRARRRVLDLGCGNGYPLAYVAPRFPAVLFAGLDFTPELLAIAAARRIPNAALALGDARCLPYRDGAFDAVYTIRCLINLLEPCDLLTAMREVARVLRPGGTYLAIECFTDGHENYNRAREECNLPPIPTARHNRYIDKQSVLPELSDVLTVVSPADIACHPGNDCFVANFLSTHYFVSRVLHPLVVAQPKRTKNSEFMRFFSFLPPMGNYAPLQALLLKRRHAS